MSVWSGEIGETPGILGFVLCVMDITIRLIYSLEEPTIATIIILDLGINIFFHQVVRIIY